MDVSSYFSFNSNKDIFSYALIVIYSIFTILRVHYGRIAKKEGGKVINLENDLSSKVLRVLIVIEVITFILYILNFKPLLSTEIPMHAVFRWAGIVIGFLSIALFLWVHRVMRSNFSSILLIRENHELIVKGPYKRVRHPMYDAFFLLHLSAFLLTANLVIGVIWIGGLVLVIALRIQREEAMMVKQFGEQYIEYQKQSGLFFPKFSKK